MKGIPVFTLEFLNLPLRYEWKLSRNTSFEKTNGLISLSYGGRCAKGEIAPNVRYQESPERVKSEFETALPQIENRLAAGLPWDLVLEGLDLCQALRTGLDMAWQNLQAITLGSSVAAGFGIKEPGPREICYTIPVMEPGRISAFIKEQNLSRFAWLKIKVNAATAREMTEQVMLHFDGKIAIDGNEAWTDPDDLMAFIDWLPPDRILFLEQPFPSSMREAYPRLKERSGIEIWGDESILGTSEPDYWKSAFSGINVKLMKAGSMAMAVQMLKDARNAGLKTMIGCMVETSLGIAAAMQLESLADFMDLDGFLLLQHEPFGFVEERDGMVFLTA